MSGAPHSARVSAGGSDLMTQKDAPESGRLLTNCRVYCPFSSFRCDAFCGSPGKRTGRVAEKLEVGKEMRLKIKN